MYLDNMSKAEEFFNRALVIFDLNQHPDISFIYKDLGDLYMRKWQVSKNKSYYTISQDFFDKSKKKCQA